VKVKPNQLHYGDNLEVLPTLPSNSVDLAYLDPPFNSQQDYNLLFREFDGSKAAAQRLVFTDTWTWRSETAFAFRRIVDAGGPIAQAMLAMRAFIGDGDLLAYLVMMAPRLVELHRVLKASGSLYLHCDPTASHYLKVLLDAVFGPERFRNEIIWKRTTAHSSAKKYAPIHDVILYYGKADRPTWKGPRAEYDPKYLDKYYKYHDGDGRLYWRNSLTAAGVRHGSSGKTWRGIDVSATGQHWKFTTEKLDELDAQGRIYWPPGGKGFPQIKRYRDELKGVAVGDLWTDIDRINQVAAERLGYPTQKPEALLERIITASSNEGDTVVDPFCGCGTTVAVAHRTKRQWIGIDVTARAIEIVENRLKALDADARKTYSLHGKPLTLEDARRLARDTGYQFQRWILELMDVLPRDIKPGADGGIDGRLYFVDVPSEGRTSEIVFSVKGGKNIGPDPIRALAGVTKGRAKIGVFVCFQATEAMMREVANAEPFMSIHGEFPSLQLLTVAEILAGKRPVYPGAPQQRLAKVPHSGAVQLELQPVEQPVLNGIGPKMAKAKLSPAKRPAARAASTRGR
jgi:site-specific DNA-methyltransferase (adenine-specific)